MSSDTVKNERWGEGGAGGGGSVLQEKTRGKSYFCLFLLSFSLKWLRYQILHTCTPCTSIVKHTIMHRCTHDTPC